MKFSWRILPTLLLVWAMLSLSAAAQGSKAAITWKRIVLDTEFRSEGAGVADVNKDGKLDVIVGDCWYEAPKDATGAWKRHILRMDRKFDLLVYSKSFCCFPDDFNGDGWPDVIVIPFPGDPCYWYENPGAKGGLWKEHLLTNSACNETPIYVDLFKTGKKILVMGWNPLKEEKDIKKGSYDDRGEMCYFLPGKDPTQPWQRISVSGPKTGKNIVPGTGRFSHGLGHGDVNGDGHVDILVPQGWWENPGDAKRDGPWKFHAANITGACADMYAYDLDGDKKADIISTSAHNYGFWWSQQRDAKSFVQMPLFQPPGEVAKLQKDHGLSADELALYQAINAVRGDEKRAPWLIHPDLLGDARSRAKTGKVIAGGSPEYRALGGTVLEATIKVSEFEPKKIAKDFLDNVSRENPSYLAPNIEIGVGVEKAKGGIRHSIVIGTRHKFSLPSQTHALQMVDINGDGLNDLVTGRRWWAHGPKGDAGPNDPAYVYWFQAKRAVDGAVSFTPHLIDDNSGIGTSFAIADMNGDGYPDVIVANKKGVHVLLQGR